MLFVRTQIFFQWCRKLGIVAESGSGTEGTNPWKANLF
jgi:hypothetical protein